jgi:glutathione S-transferase
LVRDDGVGMEESAVICHYLDHLDGNPRFDLPVGDLEWEARRLGGLASSLLDGLSVWVREIARAENEQSPTVIRHETDRASRMADLHGRLSSPG